MGNSSTRLEHEVKVDLLHQQSMLEAYLQEKQLEYNQEAEDGLYICPIQSTIKIKLIH